MLTNDTQKNGTSRIDYMEVPPLRAGNQDRPTIHLTPHVNIIIIIIIYRCLYRLLHAFCSKGLTEVPVC